MSERADLSAGRLIPDLEAARTRRTTSSAPGLILALFTLGLVVLAIALKAVL